MHKNYQHLRPNKVKRTREKITKQSIYLNGSEIKKNRTGKKQENGLIIKYHISSEAIIRKSMR